MINQILLYAFENVAAKDFNIQIQKPLPGSCPRVWLNQLTLKVSSMFIAAISKLAEQPFVEPRYTGIVFAWCSWRIEAAKTMRCDISSEEVSMHSLRSLSSDSLMSIYRASTVDQWLVKLAQNGRKWRPKSSSGVGTVPRN
jgi:hypothetical protein